MSQCGGRSSVGRAQDCDSCGRGFEPLRPPHFSDLIPHVTNCLNGLAAVDCSSCRCARVAELVDALDLGSSGATRESSSLSSRTTPLSFCQFVPKCFPAVSRCVIGPYVAAARVRLSGDSLGGANRDKLPAFKFRSFCGKTPEVGFLGLISFTY